MAQRGNKKSADPAINVMGLRPQLEMTFLAWAVEDISGAAFDDLILLRHVKNKPANVASRSPKGDFGRCPSTLPN